MANYAIQSIIPTNEVSVLSGSSGAGKTTLLFSLLKSIQNGEADWLGHGINYPLRVGLIAADRSIESYHELASRLDVDLNQLQVKSLVDDMTIDVFRLERDSLPLLKGMMQSFTNSPNLIIVDPFAIFLGVDLNNYQKVAPRLIMLGRMCKQLGVTMLCTHHASKARSDFQFMRPQDRINGSGALLGFTSTQLFLSAPEEIKKPYAELTLVPHNAPPEAIKLIRATNGAFEQFEEQEVESFFQRQVLAAVAKAPATRMQIQKFTMMAPDVLENALNQMIASHAITANVKGEYSALAVRES